jgi:O-antigen/teichoic acid export membrane protein
MTSWLLNPPPADLSEQARRSHDRRRRVLLSAMAAGLAKALAVVTILISVPLTLGYLGAERYGMWMVISSLIAVLSFADLGMGNGLLNAVAKAHGRDDAEMLRRYVSSGFAVLSVVALTFLAVLSAAYSSVDWNRLFRASGAVARQEAGPAIAAFLGVFAISLPLSIVSKVQAGLQQSFSASLWQCAGSLLSLGGLLVVVYLELGLPWLVLATLGAPAVTALCNTIHFFGATRKDLRPSFTLVTGDAARQIARTGFFFLVLQIISAVAYASDSLVIAQVLGAGAVAIYAVPEKLFSLVTIVLSIMLTPLWPAYGEAIARGDMPWVRSAFKRSLFVSLGLAIVLSAMLVALSPTLLSLWIGHGVSAPFLLIVGLGVWKVIEACGNSVAILLNGANVMRQQMLIALLTGATALPLKFYLVGQIGVAGTTWASIAAFTVVSVGPLCFWIVPRALAERQRALPTTR